MPTLCNAVLIMKTFPAPHSVRALTMNTALTVFLGIYIITNVLCLTPRNYQDTSKYETKSAEQKTSDNQKLNQSEISEYQKKEKGSDNQPVSSDNNLIYLEDVVFAIKMQNWTDEEIPCLNHTLRLLRSLQNFTLWAVWDWDSVASQPQGLLYGNRYQLGNFDECMNAPWAKTNPELRTQYCLAEIVLERTDHAVRRRVNGPVEPYHSTLDFIQYRPKYTRALNEITWGGCVPASCKPKSVERLMSVLLSRSHLGMAGMRPHINVSEPCQRADQPRPYDAQFYAFMVFIGSLVLIAIVCTYLNNEKRHVDNDGIGHNIIKAFDLKANSNDLMKVKKEGAEVLYGIRFLSIAFIVMDHQIGIFNSGPVGDGMRLDQDLLSIPGMFVLHDDLFVDTFFFLSGFLVASAFKSIKKSMFNPLLIIFRRYLRLSIGFAVVIFFYCAIFPYTGNGPLWNRVVEGETDPCRKNWWLSLLMVNNYVDSENICIVVSWYIPCDFHFFVVTTLAYYLYNHHRRLGLTCAILFAASSLLVPGIVNYFSQLPAVQLFIYEFVRNPRANEQFHVTYIKSHTRFGAYVVGFFAGYLYAYYKATGHLKRLSKTWSIAGVGAGLAIMTTVLLIGPTYLWRSYHPLEGALYAALNRPVWAAGVALLTLSCIIGYVPLVENFLSWYPWVPLSRLAYGLYLTHAIFITRNVFVTRGSRYNDYVLLFAEALGVIMLGLLSSLLIWLLAEAPANNLFSLLIKPRKKSSRHIIEEASCHSQHASTSSIISSKPNGHLDANLPSTIHYSSKV